MLSRRRQIIERQPERGHRAVVLPAVIRLSRDGTPYLYCPGPGCTERLGRRTTPPEIGVYLEPGYTLQGNEWRRGAVVVGPKHRGRAVRRALEASESLRGTRESLEGANKLFLRHPSNTPKRKESTLDSHTTNRGLELPPTPLPTGDHVIVCARCRAKVLVQGE